GHHRRGREGPLQLRRGRPGGCVGALPRPAPPRAQARLQPRLPLQERVPRRTEQRAGCLPAALPAAGRRGGVAVNVSPALRRASLMRTGARALLQLAGFLVVALLARRLAPADLGAYRLLAVLQSLTALLGALGTPAALLYALGRARTEEERAQAAA